MLGGVSVAHDNAPLATAYDNAVAVHDAMKTRGNVGHQTRVVIAALANFLLRFGVGQAMTSKVLDRRLAIGPSGARAVYGRPGPKTRRHVIGGGHPQRRIPALAQPAGQYYMVATPMGDRTSGERGKSVRVRVERCGRRAL